jgi:hypothetical protein
MTRYIVLAATCLALSGAATTRLAAQEPGRGERQQKATDAIPDRLAGTLDVVGQTAFETREQLQRLLRQYPPTLSGVLRIDPTLLANTQYLGMYPGLAAFLAQHPEIAHNPGFFIGNSYSSGFVFETPRMRGVDGLQAILAGLALFLGFILVVGLTAWGLRTFVEHRRWLRVSKIQTDAHSKLLDRLTSNEDLLAYIQSSAGRQFLEAAPFPTLPKPAAISAPINRILWSVQAGVVLVLAGAGLWVGRGFVGDDLASGFSVMGVMIMFLGAGFVISALVAYALSKVLGLFESPALHPHA